MAEIFEKLLRTDALENSSSHQRHRERDLKKQSDQTSNGTADQG
jgi:hypothetical protein